MSFTLIGKHEKDSRANRDGYVSAMLEIMEKDPTVMHVDCDLENCINTGKLAKAYPERTINAGIAASVASGVQSLADNPVPPVVKTISTLISSHNL